MKRTVVWLIALFATLLLSVACKNGDDQNSGVSAAPKSNQLPALELKDDTQDLLLTYLDEKGDFHTSQKISDIPENYRSAVRVVVTTKEEGTGELVYVADVSKKGADGTYPVTTETRAAWDERGAKLRKKRLEALAPKASAAPSGSAASPPTVAPPNAKDTGEITAVVYGAVWCKPCDAAARYLKKRGVKVVKKDIEKSPAAKAEMRRKLAKANRGGAQIPVIDLGGRILIGYSPRALDRALKALRDAEPL